MERTFIIGDLHGCYKEACELLEQCEVTSEDRVIFVGDLVDRGPDSDKCVDLAMKYDCILGNHEEKHLQYRKIEESGKKLEVKVDTHIATREQLTDRHYEYFKSLPLYIKLPEYNAAVVHAGVWPNIPIEKQDAHHLLHMQMINPEFDQDGRVNKASKWPSKAPADWKFWTHYWQGPELVIFGHSVIDKPLITENAIGIDGGAVFGRELWALELPSKIIHRVKSKTNKNRGFRGRPNDGGNKIATYNIHADVSCFS